MNKKHIIPRINLALLLKQLGMSNFVLLETTKVTDDEHLSYLFTDPVTYLRLTEKASVEDFLQEAQAWVDQGYYLAGWLAYEMGYLLEASFGKRINLPDKFLLAELGVFKKPFIYDHERKEDNDDFLHANSTKGQSAPPEEVGEFSLRNLHLNLTKEQYFKAIDSIKKYIVAGDTYQVNYTLKLLFDFSGSPIELYNRLRSNQSVPYGAYIQKDFRRVMSFSPELFFRRKNGVCTVRPMKGTVKRGRTVAEDKKNILFLQNDSKNRSENVMIVDLLRNDLGRLAKHGTVHVSSLFDVEQYETLFQMTSTISGTLPGSVGLFDLFKALFPCGSVTGAPKIRTMEIIEELEKEARGVYTGAIGFIAPGGDALFNVPIRTVVLENGKGQMGIGSGIVHDSDPLKEWQECQLKADFLTRPSAEFDLIETLLWQPDSGYWLFEEHLDRIADSADYFYYPFDRQEVRDALMSEAGGFSGPSGYGECWRVRLLLSADGDFAVSSNCCDEPSFALNPDNKEHPLVIFSENKTDSGNPFYFHKTTLRQLYNSEREKAVAKGFYEVLFSNERGEVTEGAISTVFIRKDNVFYTPTLTCGLLPGIFRSHFLSGSAGVQVQEKILFPEDLFQADALYVANSVRGIVQVDLVKSS